MDEEEREKERKRMKRIKNYSQLNYYLGLLQ